MTGAIIKRGGLTALALVALGAPMAQAHVTIQPSESRPADLQLYRLIVPNESSDGADTTGVEVGLPEGIDFLLMEDTEGWDAELIRKDGLPAELRWTGGELPADGFSELSFIARNPVEVGEARFPTIQTYDDGTEARWIGPADGDEPTPAVRIAEDVTPVDVVSVHGDETGSANESDAAAPAAVIAGSSPLPVILGVVATVLAALALLVALRRPRGS